ncbi:hypothetical protein BDZ89DRAFT_967236, partial [Hymenopellis radicata]
MNVSVEKPPLNRRSRRRLARDIARVGHVVKQLPNQDPEKPLIELKQWKARPPGCTFLGSTATEAIAQINGAELVPVIVDSGSDITLIAQETLKKLSTSPKIKIGQQVNLIQVTGQSSVNGFVNVDLLFETPEGPVQFSVDAYIVKGMSTPFILGNDFADQYSISIMRRDGEAYLVFGDSGRELRILERRPGLTRHQSHRKGKKLRRRNRMEMNKGIVRADKRVVIAPETCMQVPV